MAKTDARTIDKRRNMALLMMLMRGFPEAGGRRSVVAAGSVAALMAI
jgi:hypothetical protein